MQGVQCASTCPNSSLPAVRTPYHSLTHSLTHFRLSPSQILVSITFSFPTTQTHLLPLILPARRLLGSLRSGRRCVSFDYHRVLGTCLPPIVISPLCDIQQSNQPFANLLQDVAFHIMTICVLLGTSLNPKSTFPESLSVRSGDYYEFAVRKPTSTYTDIHTHAHTSTLNILHI